MNKSYIAVFDSGVGGLHILESLVKEYKNENFIYLADEDFFPYGVKTKEQLENRLTLIANKLSEMDVKAIVIACNTASANSHHLKEFIKIPIIEIITATANYAKTVTLNNKIGVWATNATISSNKYQEALSDVVCYAVKASDLVELIENNLLNETIPFVNKHLEEIKDADSLILGCTHFPLLSEIIKEINPSLLQISSNIPVNVAVEKLLDELDLHNDSNDLQIIKLYTTKISGELKDKARRFNITFNSVDYLEIK